MEQQTIFGDEVEEQIEQTWIKQIPVKNKSIYHRSIYTTQFSLNDSIALYNYMYSNANVYLLRKKQVFDNYLLDYKPRKRFRDYNGLPK